MAVTASCCDAFSTGAAFASVAASTLGAIIFQAAVERDRLSARSIFGLSTARRFRQVGAGNSWQQSCTALAIHATRVQAGGVPQ